MRYRRSLAGLSDRGAIRGGLFRGGIGDDAATPPAESVPEAVDSPILGVLDQRTATILKRIDDQDRARKWALMIAGASALFAAVKLGIVAFPAIRSRIGSGDS